MKFSLSNLPKLAKERYAENKKYLEKLKKKPPKNLDYVMEEINTQVFREIDCLQCANCCKTTGPLFTNADIERIAKFLKLKPQQFIDQYLQIDEDRDYVLKQLPCVFLGADNYCMIYEQRPKACRAYPHIDHKKVYQINTIMLKNTAICPAVHRALEEMKKKMPL